MIGYPDDGRVSPRAWLVQRGIQRVLQLSGQVPQPEGERLVRNPRQKQRKLEVKPEKEGICAFFTHVMFLIHLSRNMMGLNIGHIMTRVSNSKTKGM